VVHIQDERVLEQCVGSPAKWWTLIRREVVVGAMMTGRLSPEPGGPTTGRAPPANRGIGG
jgi:hypothetical protein